MMVAKEGQLEMTRGEPITDPELLRQLRTREELRSAAAMYRRVSKEVSKMAEPHLLDLQQHQCGEFLLRGTRLEESRVEYDKKAAFRISVKKMKNGHKS